MLLPEASLTGYVSPRFRLGPSSRFARARGPRLDFDLAPFAEPADGPTARALAALAREHRTHLFGPLVERDGEYVYNTCIGFDRVGREIVRYRKRHPWYPETWATPGDAPHPSFEVEGLRVTIAICFDIHFVNGFPEGGTPPTRTAGALPDADVLLFPSAWVEEEDTRPTMLPELARRAGLTIVNANWGPGEPRLPGQGNSCIVQPSGAISVLPRAAHRVDLELPG